MIEVEILGSLPSFLPLMCVFSFFTCLNYKSNNNVEFVSCMITAMRSLNSFAAGQWLVSL